MVTRDQFRAAQHRAEAQRRQGPLATEARYNQRARRVVVTLDSGLELSFAPENAEGLENAKARDLAAIEVTSSGLGLHFPALDTDLYLPALLDGLTGSRKWMAARLGQAGGRARSMAKVAASRENGRLGGRPVERVAKGAVRDRTQVLNAKARDRTKRDSHGGRLIEQKAAGKPAKGGRKAK